MKNILIKSKSVKLFLLENLNEFLGKEIRIDDCYASSVLTKDLYVKKSGFINVGDVVIIEKEERVTGSGIEVYDSSIYDAIDYDHISIILKLKDKEITKKI